MLEIVTKVIGWIIQVLPIFIILRPRPRTYGSTSPLVLLQLHQQQQLFSINIINSTIHHLQHAKLRILLQHLTSHAAYERSCGSPKRPAAKRPCILVLVPFLCPICTTSLARSNRKRWGRVLAPSTPLNAWNGKIFYGIHTKNCCWLIIKIEYL